MKEVVSNSEEETIKIASEFGQGVKPGDVICLYGDLGAGKTHFVKGFVKSLGIDPAEVRSPTYTLVNEYSGDLPVFHFDCYRLEHAEEALEFGAEEYFYGGGVCIIEWPERIDSILPANYKSVTIKPTGKTARILTFQN